MTPSLREEDAGLRAGRSAAVLLALTLGWGAWFTASYAKLIDEVAWHRSARNGSA